MNYFKSTHPLRHSLAMALLLGIVLNSGAICAPVTPATAAVATPGSAASTPAVAKSELAVYHVGNSLTGDLWTKLSEIITEQQKSQGNSYCWQAHYRGATCLTSMSRKPEGAGTQSNGVLGGYSWKSVGEAGFVPWTTALPGRHWDIVTLQPWQDDIRATQATEVAAINGMIAAAKTRADNANTRFVIYAAWAKTPFDNLNGFREDFCKPTPNSPDQLVEATRDCFRHLTDEVRRTYPSVTMIPAGEVFLALDAKMQAGKFENFTSIRQLHRDVIHLNSAGCNVVAWTAYAVLFKKSPVGLPNNPIPSIDYPPFKNVTQISPADQKLIQETIWETVTSPDLRGYTGVQ